jgi:hypothetical protein
LKLIGIENNSGAAPALSSSDSIGGRLPFVIFKFENIGFENNSGAAPAVTYLDNKSRVVLFKSRSTVA